MTKPKAIDRKKLVAFVLCTRMAEQGLDMKVMQYIIGHANIGVTMEVCNHIAERARIENEIAEMDAVQVV